jgi:hypothetical protein
MSPVIGPALGMLGLAAVTGVAVDRQHLDVHVDPAAHVVRVEATIALRGDGRLRLDLTDRAEDVRVRLDDAEIRPDREAAPDRPVATLVLRVPGGRHELTIAYAARLEQDVAAGERPGEIHNFSVDAHVGPDGVFLSDGSAWHPRPLDDAARPLLHPIEIEIDGPDGWAFVASGDPVHDGPLTEPCLRWATSRPVDGMALAGNEHALLGRVHPTAHGPVEVVMHVPAERAELASMFIDAACSYLDLYVPRLGPFPYRRFSIVENFFSSGFAYPGFTLLGPQVVAMAPRSLAPGYLDHELVHNWWGNGVYVDPDDGNWCEALTSYCSNYGRRGMEQGAEAARAYRRGVLMRLSADPDGLDDGPLGTFGRADPDAPGPGRFVGYDKGAFVFMMLADRLAGGPAGGGDDPMWTSLRRFATTHLGRRAAWDDLQAAFEAQRPERPAGWLDGFFEFWVRGDPVPRTVPTGPADAARDFAAQIAATTGQHVEVIRGAGAAWVEIDPDFRVYRALPPEQITPTVGGTFGVGGCMVAVDDARPEVESFLRTNESEAGAENLLVIGLDAARRHAGLLGRTADPVAFGDGFFTVGGTTYGGPDQALLHTMPHPDRPGRFVTVFLANGDAGWSRLRVIRFYTRDTTIVWEGGRVIARRLFEPDRRIGLGSGS